MKNGDFPMEWGNDPKTHAQNEDPLDLSQCAPPGHCPRRHTSTGMSSSTAATACGEAKFLVSSAQKKMSVCEIQLVFLVGILINLQNNLRFHSQP